MKIVRKLPKEILITGRQLFEVIHLIHQGIDNEVERVKKLKALHEQNNSQSVVVNPNEIRGATQDQH